MSYDRDWKAAEASFREALDLNPHEPTALQNYGLLLHANGRFEEATTMFARAYEVDPLSPYVATMTLWPLNQGRRYDEAIASARRLLATDSTVWYPRFILAQALAFSGRNAQAVGEFERVVATEGIPITRAWLGWAYSRVGRTRDTRRILAELDSVRAVHMSSRTSSPSFTLALGITMKRCGS